MKRTPEAKSRRRRRRRWIALAVCLLLVLPAISYVRALTYPGNATFAVRSVDWVRDHGGGRIIDAIETWRYSRQAPPAIGAPQDTTTNVGGPVAAPRAKLPVVRLLPGVSPLDHEGQWTSARRAGSRTLLWTTWLRPDADHLPVTAAAALIPRRADRVYLGAGTREPVPDLLSPGLYQVPAPARSKLVATFNGGFKTRDSRGGWWTRQHAAVPLVDGRASIVLYDDGSGRVGAWGNDLGMTPDVVAVRQNLDLVISHGRVADGLATNADGSWGTTRSQFQYTWRSGIGTDAHGNLIYVAGHGLTLATLAAAMRKAGVEQGMELDIHTWMVSFNINQPGRDGSIISRRLLPSMKPSADRYLSDDQRDFFYVVAS